MAKTRKGLNKLAKFIPPTTEGHCPYCHVNVKAVESHVKDCHKNEKLVKRH